MFDVRCSMFDVRCSMFDVRCSPFRHKPPQLRTQLSSNPQSTTPHAERMNTNAEHPTSNAQRRTEEAKITAGTAHLSLLLLFGSTLDVRRAMFDVRVSSGPRAALFQSKIQNLISLRPPTTRAFFPTPPNALRRLPIWKYFAIPTISLATLGHSPCRPAGPRRTRPASTTAACSSMPGRWPATRPRPPTSSKTPSSPRSAVTLVPLE